MEQDRADIAAHRATVHLEQGRPDAALHEVEQGLAQVPHDVDLMRLRALALVEMERPQDALAAANHCVTAAPDAPDGHLVAGMALLKIGNARDAVAAAGRAAQLAPFHAGAHRVLARAHAATGKHGYEAGRAAAARAIELEPDNPASHLAMADVEFPEGRSPGKERLARAEHHVQLALQLDPGSTAALNERARIQLARRQGAQAAGTLARAVAGSPQEQLLHENMDAVLLNQVAIAHWVLFIAYFVLARATDGYERGWVAAIALAAVLVLAYLVHRLFSEVRTSRAAYLRGFARRNRLATVWLGLLVVSVLAFVGAALVPPAGGALLVVAAVALVVGAILSWVAYLRGRKKA